MILYNFGNLSIGFHHLRSLTDILLTLLQWNLDSTKSLGTGQILFGKLNVRCIENLDISNLRETTKMFVISRS